MRVPLSWLRQVLPGLTATVEEIDLAFNRLGLEVEEVHRLGADLQGPLLVGRVLEIEELTGFKKPVRYCLVLVGDETRGIVCGAQNFAVGDLVVASLPGAVLPGPFPIAARETYGRTSDGMICSARELGLGDDHSGILVLGAGTPGDDAISLLGLVDEVVELAVTADRGYCMSLRGVARELATAFDLDFVEPAAAPPPAADGAWPVRIDDAAGCDRYVARLVSGVSAGAAVPTSLADTVVKSGMRSVSVAVDVTNHVMLLLGQPLHAFDADTLQGGVVVRRATVGEKLTTLDGVARLLDAEDLVIADDSGPIALAGVMGGATTEVTAATTRILVEAAHFDAVSVSRTARRHKLGSEASRRFERGVDPLLAPTAAQRAVDLLVEHASAVVERGQTDVGVAVTPTVLELDPQLATRVAGRPYPNAVVRMRLEQVGCLVTSPTLSEQDESYEITVPSWRPDLDQTVALVEEVLRLEGYDTIPSVLPVVVAGLGGLTTAQRLRRRALRAAAADGWTQVLSYPFVAPSVHDDFGLDADDARRDAVRLLNPLSEAEPELRTSLLPGLLSTLRRNVSRGMRDLAVFESGLVYRARSGTVARRLLVDGPPTLAELSALDAALPQQPVRIAFAAAGQRELMGWNQPGRPADWADAVEAVQAVASVLGVELKVVADVHAPWHPGRCARLSLADGTLVGHAGELAPRVCVALDLPPRSVAAELDLSVLVEAAGDVLVVGPPVSPFPPVFRDVALVVSGDTPAGLVEKALAAGAGELVEDVRLFDDYALEGGERSLAFALRLRATDRTLTDAEANASRDAGIETAAAATGARLRS